MPDDLTDDERDARIGLLTAAIQDSKYPLSPRIQRLKRTNAGTMPIAVGLFGVIAAAAGASFAVLPPPAPRRAASP